MTDKGLYEHIRRLVREQKAAQGQLDVGHENFAQEYCRFQMLKKKTVHAQENRMNTLLKNFRSVESYINIMDILRNLQLSLATPNDTRPAVPEDALPQIIPKSLQLKMREELGPILSKRYEEDSAKREEVARTLREGLVCSGEELRREESLPAGVGPGEGRQRFQLIDVLRKDIRRKEVYFLQQRFDRQMDDIGRLPKKVQDSKLFHKICSYLHMVLEQEHKEKWASRQEKRFKEDHRRLNVRKKMRIPTLIRNYSNELSRTTSSNFRTTNPSVYRQAALRNSALPKNAHFQDDVIDSCSQEEGRDEGARMGQQRESFRKVQSKQELVKQNFTFRRRGVKAGLMVKINEFVDHLNDEQRKNSDASKKYAKALLSLGEQLETSYGKFKREQLAQQQDIQDMKKYLDNTLSRNKKDLKKFHHK